MVVDNMAKLDVDTAKLKEYCKTIDDYINEYNELVNNLFDAYSKICINGVWTGSRADKFVSDSKKVKEVYVNLGNELKKYTFSVNMLSDKLNTSVTNNNIK